MVARGNSWVGLDVLPETVCAAALSQGPGGAMPLKAAVIQELPQPASGGAGNASWLSAVLAELPSRTVHATLSHAQVVVRRLCLPLMGAEELREAARWQMKEQVPFPVEGARILVHPLGEVWDKDIRKQEVLAIVASPEAITAQRRLLEAGGARVDSLVPRELAVARAVSHYDDAARTGTVAVAEIGAERAVAMVLRDGAIRLTRVVEVGERTLAGAMVGVVTVEAGDVTIDAESAKAILRQYGVLAEGVEGATSEGVPLFHIASLMRPALEQLVTELARLLDSYRVQVDEVGVSRMVLCGAGATIGGLAPFLASALGVPVTVFEPPAGPSAKPTPALAAALGAALLHGVVGNLAREDAPSGKAGGIALWERTARAIALTGAAACVALGLVCAGVAIHAHAQRQARAALGPAYEQLTATRARREAALGLVRDAANLTERQPAFEGLWKELGVLIPAHMVIDELRLAAEEPTTGIFTVRITGHVTGAAGRAGLADLVDALGTSPFLDEMRLAGAEMRTGDSTASQFTLEGMLE